LTKTEKKLITGELGEIIVQSDHAMMGYLNRPEETRAKLVDGWIHTGDIGESRMVMST